MRNKKVTIAIPYYNSSPFLLRRCINSCLNQSYENIEVIVLTDGSPYDISKLVGDYSRDECVIFHLSDENRGVSYRRNLAIDLSSGDYIQFVDADDFIEPNMVETMLNHMSSDNSDLVICAMADNRFSVDNGIFDTKTVCSQPSVFNYIQYTNYVTNKIFKVSIIKDNKLCFDEGVKLGEDALFCVSYIKHAKYITCIDKPLYHYIPNAQSATLRYDDRYVEYESLVIGAISSLFTSYPLCKQEQCSLESWNKDKILGCLGYYRDRKKKRIISTKEFRVQSKKIKELGMYRGLSLPVRLKIRLITAPIISLII